MGDVMTSLWRYTRGRSPLVGDFTRHQTCCSIKVHEVKNLLHSLPKMCALIFDHIFFISNLAEILVFFNF